MEENKTEEKEVGESSIVFGPVPSRRLGRSLGINNIPPKICTYACVYCQIGRTLKMKLQRESYYDVDFIKKKVDEKLKILSKNNENVDYLTFVPDGEPTLDINLRSHIVALKSFGIKVAVITNTSLIWERDVQEALLEADWVSIKIDSVNESVWRKIDRPHGKIKLEDILKGLLEFSENYRGYLVSETMLVRDVNDEIEVVDEIANFISTLNVKVSYLSVPTRPPWEKWVKPPTEYKLYLAFNIFENKMINPELLIGYEGNSFSSTGDLKTDILSITAVHPMREDAIEEYLRKSGNSWKEFEKLVIDGLIERVEYNGKNYYLRKLG